MTRVLDLPIARLATTLAPLRGRRTDPASALAPLPVRVAANEDGTYEVLDGFKRVARWIADGQLHVPAVVEEALGVVRKARLLERLQRESIPIRAMARRLGRDVKTIRRALGRPVLVKNSVRPTSV